ncbi:unnamed protein product [Arctia plantaginis]|uniref:Catalase core domain-containing protein n=1 Tax=Arctia plantaginis TaxID=874455 RepID=A0A8S0YSM6_ARCPL|nr:unnamed protein product [Arctia plantaginis]
MVTLATYVGLCSVLIHVSGYRYHNGTEPDPASQQLPEFRQQHPMPIGVWTKLSGEPLDVRDTQAMNTDLFIHRNHFRLTSHNTRERIPERIMFAKGSGAFGYFEVTHDVSKYIKSDVFNEIGKRTPVTARFSSSFQNLGGPDLVRELKGMSVKMYTREGNLDFVNINLPVYFHKDPIMFPHLLHAFKRNPRTEMFDFTARWDLTTSRPHILNALMWMASDFGLPDGYRKMNSYPIHVYIIYNKYGKKSFVKFNFRTETGLQNLTDARAKAIVTEDADYFNRDLYNAIAEKNYPSWKVDMDILTEEDLMTVNYDPFDVTRLWKRGTYRTVSIGRLVLNHRVNNHFSDIEQVAFSPDNLVPGILGPVDSLYRARKVFYVDAQHYRLGVNFDNIIVNAPLYDKFYSRDGKPPLWDNMNGAPNYYPNSFNGPMPFVDEDRPLKNLLVYQGIGADLQTAAEFYNEIVESDAHRQRIANYLANTLTQVPWDVEKKAIYLLNLVSKDLGKRVRMTLDKLRAENAAARRNDIAQCIADVTRLNIHRSVNKYFNQYD